MRRLHAPTLAQWGCQHRWKTTTSRPGEGEVVRMRYLTCLRCGLKVKTEERLAVPWDERDLVAQVNALLPEGKVVALWDKGMTELPLARLNARLAPQGYVIRAVKGRGLRRLVACIDEDGQVEQYALFELLHMRGSVRGSASGDSRCEHEAGQPIAGTRRRTDPERERQL